MCDSISEHKFKKEFQGIELETISAAQLDARVKTAAEIVAFLIDSGLKILAGESACSLVWAIRERDQRQQATKSKLAGGFCQSGL